MGVDSDKDDMDDGLATNFDELDLSLASRHASELHYCHVTCPVSLYKAPQLCSIK